MRAPTRDLILPSIAALALLACDAGSPRATRGPHAGQAPLTELLVPVATPLPPPGPGDWLAEHEEPGQTLAEYTCSQPPLPTPERTTLYVQPLGTFPPESRAIIERTVEYLGLYYGLPVEALAPLPLNDVPADAVRAEGRGFGRQVHSGWILHEVLRPGLPEDGAAILGLTATDLWPGRGWNFVFGEASIERRVGVWSIARYGDPARSEQARTLALARTLKVASHETGHMFGLLHCTAWSCNMNGSNHLGETDRQPMSLCPECAAKVVWGTGTDPAARAEALARFGDRHRLPGEAVTTWSATADVLRASAVTRR